MARVTDTVAALALPVAEAAGCSLWDVEYVKEAGQWFLRVEVRLYRPRDSRKEFVGTLKGYEDGAVTLDIGGESAFFTKQEIALVRLYPGF